MAATAAATPKTKAPRKSTSKAAWSPFGASLRPTAGMFQLAGDPTRLQILTMLIEKPLYVGEMCAQIGQTQPAVSHHLALLRHSRLIEVRRAGKNNFYSLTDAGRVLAETAVGFMRAGEASAGGEGAT